MYVFNKNNTLAPGQKEQRNKRIKELKKKLFTPNQSLRRGGRVTTSRSGRVVFLKRRNPNNGVQWKPHPTHSRYPVPRWPTIFPTFGWHLPIVVSVSECVMYGGVPLFFFVQVIELTTHQCPHINRGAQPPPLPRRPCYYYHTISIWYGMVWQ